MNVPRGWNLRPLRRVGGVPRGWGETVSRAQAPTLRRPAGTEALVVLATAAVAVSRPERVGVVEAVVKLARSPSSWGMASAAASVAALSRVGTGQVVAATETVATLSRLTPTKIWPSHCHQRAVAFNCSGCRPPPSPSAGNDGGYGSFHRQRRRGHHQFPVHHGDDSVRTRCRRRPAVVRRGPQG